jgi:tetratricopeptide (TPR) repeat protein
LRNTLITVAATAWALSAEPGDRSRFEQATAALQKGDFRAAREGFEAVLAAEPDHLAAMGNLGVVYARQAEYTRAEDLYRRGLRLAPGNALLELNLGLALFKQGKFGAAVPRFRAVLAKESANRQARELLATSLIQSGAEADALKLLDPASNDPGVLYLRGLAYSRLKQESEARAVFDGLFRAASPAQARYLVGRARVESGQYEEGAADLEQAANLEPGLDGVHREAGRALISLRRFEEADARLRKAIEANGADAEARYLLGGVLVQRGLWNDALVALDVVIEQQPGAWGAHYYRGRALLGLRNAAGAIEALERAAELAPEEAPVFFQLARAYQSANRPAEAARARARMTGLRSQRVSEEPVLLR